MIYKISFSYFQCNSNYSYFHFEDQNSIQGVPTEWISKLQGQDYCHFPDKNLNPSKLVKKMKSVDPSWLLHPCTIKDKASSYEMMLQLEKDFLHSTDCQDSEKSEISDLEEISDDEMVALLPMAKRKNLQIFLFILMIMMKPIKQFFQK